MKHTKTLKVRVRDNHRAVLNDMARNVNFVWNYINELSHRLIKERGVFLSGYDLQKYTNGSGKLLGLHSHTVQCVGKEYATRRKQFKRARLNWRKSGGVRRSLGWVPVNTGMAQWKSGQVYFNGRYFKVWDSYGLSQHTFKSASFNEDACGRWYFNVVVELESDCPAGQDKLGIDLGLKDTATCSDGAKLEAGHFYQDLEPKLAIAQRARNKKRIKAIHAKIANRRKDALHKFSRQLVNRSGEIYVGNVKSSSLTKTKMAKSVLDAGWAMLKTMLEYKCAGAGIVFKEVNESYTTQTCSSCGCLPDSRPRGIAGLGIRVWTCSECGVIHDRDINAARNILAVGLHRPVEGKVTA
jgi:IS605 OrfB family transposase